MDKYTIRNVDGSVNIDESMLAYGNALADWTANKENMSGNIETAIEAVFDRYPDKRLPMPSLLAYAVAELGTDPSQHKKMTTACHDYVVNQSAKNTGRIDIGKGKGGGVKRLAAPGQPIPVRPAKNAV
jgi:hypothetical protein